MATVRTAMLALAVLALATTMIGAPPVEIEGERGLIFLNVDEILSAIEPDEDINTGSIIKAPGVQAKCDGMIDRQGKCRTSFGG